jgi:hypothetical protein
MTQEADVMAKYLPKADEYEVVFLRNMINVRGIEINQWKAITFELIEKIESLEKARHIDALNRQKDTLKIGEMSIENSELKKTNQLLLEKDEEKDRRISELEKRMNNASEYIAKIEKSKGQK